MMLVMAGGHVGGEVVGRVACGVLTGAAGGTIWHLTTSRFSLGGGGGLLSAVMVDDTKKYPGSFGSLGPRQRSPPHAQRATPQRLPSRSTLSCQAGIRAGRGLPSSVRSNRTGSADAARKSLGR